MHRMRCLWGIMRFATTMRLATLLSVLVLACDEKNGVDEFVTAKDIDTNWRDMLVCSPDTLYWGDTLTISMRTPHEEYLSVTTPDDHDFYVVWWQTEAPDYENQVSLMDPDEFSKTSHFEIVTDKTKASPVIYGKKDNELIFSTLGVYTIRLSQQLSTDDPNNIVYEYPVFYKGRR